MEEINDLSSLATTRFHDAHQDTLGVSARIGTASAPHLAVHDCRTECLFCSVIGSIQAGLQQEPKPFVKVILEMVRQLLVSRVLPGALNKLLQIHRQLKETVCQVILS